MVSCGSFIQVPDRRRSRQQRRSFVAIPSGRETLDSGRHPRRITTGCRHILGLTLRAFDAEHSVTFCPRFLDRSACARAGVRCLRRRRRRAPPHRAARGSAWGRDAHRARRGDGVQDAEDAVGTAPRRAPASARAHLAALRAPLHRRDRRFGRAHPGRLMGARIWKDRGFYTQREAFFEAVLEAVERGGWLFSDRTRAPRSRSVAVRAPSPWKGPLGLLGDSPKRCPHPWHRRSKR